MGRLAEGFKEYEIRHAPEFRARLLHYTKAPLWAGEDLKGKRILIVAGVPLGTPGAYIAEFGWAAQGAQAPDLNTMWTADATALTPGHPVTLTTQMPDGVRYQIKISVDDGYLFTGRQSTMNGSGKPVVVRPIGLVSRGAKSSDPSTWTNHVGPISVFGGKADYDVFTLESGGANTSGGATVTGTAPDATVSTASTTNAAQSCGVPWELQSLAV